MDYKQRVNDIAVELAQSVDTNFFQTKIMPKIIKNINESEYVNNAVKKKFMSGGTDRSKRLRLSNLKGGGDVVVKDALEIIISHYLSDINKYEAKLLNLLDDKGYDNKIMVKFLIVNNDNDIRSVCKMNNISDDMCSKIIDLKKMSALYKIENNF